METKTRKSREEISTFADLYLEFTGGDIGLIKVLEREVSARAYSDRASKEKEKRRYVRQQELNEICEHILYGESFVDAIHKVAEKLEVSCAELHTACNTNHKVEFLNNMYDSATEDNYTKFRILKDEGYLKKSDYKGRVRPRTGLKNIERAVALKDKVDNLVSRVNELEHEQSKTNANMTIVKCEVDDISTLLKLGMSDEEKIGLLLNNGYTTNTIMEIVGCNKHKVSRVRKKLRGQLMNDQM